MGFVAHGAVAAAVVASLACLAQRVARVPAWPLLLWLLAAQLPRSWSISSFIGAAGCAMTAYAVLPSSPWLAGGWALAALVQLVLREKPQAEFELM
jgi:hypothetical protein